MEEFKQYLLNIEDLSQRNRLKEILLWVEKTFPTLKTRVAWNQPMYTNHGTFIIGFSTSKKHLLIAPEVACINHFSDEIVSAGYDHTKGLLRIPWNKDVNFNLIQHIIEYNIDEKAECKTFWR